MQFFRQFKFRFIIAIAITLAGLLGIILLIARSVDNSSNSLASNPYAVMVGSYRYVNACQTVPASQYQAVFGFAKSNVTSSDDIHAEGSHTKHAVITSSCTTTFGYVPPVNNDPLTQGERGRTVLLVYQYPDTDAAKLTFAQDTGNTFSYTVATVGAVKVAYSKSLATRFEFLYRNSVVSVDVAATSYYRGADKLVVTPQYTSDVAKKLVPIITASINNPNLSQTRLQSADSGKPLAGAGSATVINPCQVFTGADFQAALNSEEDDSEVGSVVPNSPVTQGAKAQSLENGRTSTSCTRKGYIATAQPDITDYNNNSAGYLAAQKSYAAIVSPTMTATYQLYDSAAEAVQWGNEKIAGIKSSYSDFKTTPCCSITAWSARMPVPANTIIHKTTKPTSM